MLNGFKWFTSADNLRSQYRELAKNNHPDKVGERGTVNMQEINAEYDRLKKGERYSKRTQEERSSSNANAGGSWNAYKEEQRRRDEQRRREQEEARQHAENIFKERIRAHEEAQRKKAAEKERKRRERARNPLNYISAKMKRELHKTQNY